MGNYLVNYEAQPTGEHEVHIDTCNRLPEPKNRISLGYCRNSKEAIEKAKFKFSKVDGCHYCCNESDTK